MVIFLLLYVPLWFFYLNSFFQNEGIRKRDFLIPLGKGFVLYVVSLLLTWLFTNRLVLGDVNFPRVFVYDFKFYNGLTSFIWIILFFLTNSLNGRKGKGYPLRETMIFLCALFLGDSLYRLLIKESWYGTYELFILPLDNMGLINLLTLLLVRMHGSSLLKRFLLLLISLTSLVIYNVIPTLFTLNYPLPAVLGSVILFAVTFFLFFSEIRGDLAGSSLRFIKRGEPENEKKTFPDE
jgi:hypothetical protein